MSRAKMREDKDGKYDAIMHGWQWSVEEEDEAIALHKECNNIVKVARKMKIPYRSVQMMLQRRGIVPTKSQDIRLVHEMCKMYPEAEVCERLNMTPHILRGIAKEHGLTVYKHRGDMPKADAMPYDVNHRTFALLCNAVAQAMQEKFAIIEVHEYSKGALIRDKRGSYVEFRVINERHKRFNTGKKLELEITDIYVKTPKEGRFIINQDDVEKYSNVINNNITVIYNDYDRD